MARADGVAYNTLLEHFVLARFLARLNQSPYADRFVLKDAQLFRMCQSYRPLKPFCGRILVDSNA